MANKMHLNTPPHTDLPSSARPDLRLLHVVRRYGPVGGMERYVWELTMQLRELGYPVIVVCERCHVEKPPGIEVHELGEVLPRPRWLAALRFSGRVARWLAANPQPNALIHSHERIDAHDITTFHGTSFRTVLERPWWKRMSLRVAMQLFLERQELKTARYIVPNSRLIKQQLAHYYPEYVHKLVDPVWPGVTAGKQREDRVVPHDGGVVGFVGTEWKRKGLPAAVAAVKRLRRSRPDLQFVVIGPDAAEVQHLFADWQDGYTLKGWSDHVSFDEFDVLLHPAKLEPYGMVISEAMAAKVPVVFSDACGAEIHSALSGAVLPLDAPTQVWVDALEQQLSRTEPVPQYQRGWDDVAQEYAREYAKVGYRREHTAVGNAEPEDKFELARSFEWLHDLLAPNEQGVNYYREGKS